MQILSIHQVNEPNDGLDAAACSQGLVRFPLSNNLPTKEFRIITRLNIAIIIMIIIIMRYPFVETLSSLAYQTHPIRYMAISTNPFHLLILFKSNKVVHVFN